MEPDECTWCTHRASCNPGISSQRETPKQWHICGWWPYISINTEPDSAKRKSQEASTTLYRPISCHNETSMVALEFQVRWTLGDMTWELILACQELEALDIYLELWEVAKPCNLPKWHSLGHMYHMTIMWCARDGTKIFWPQIFLRAQCFLEATTTPSTSTSSKKQSAPKPRAKVLIRAHLVQEPWKILG